MPFPSPRRSHSTPETPASPTRRPAQHSPAGTDAEPAEEAHYRILSFPLSVTASYTPRLILYCAVSEADASLASVDAIQLLQQEGNTSQQNRSFHGDIQVWLRGNTLLEYVINGDFYNGGTTTALASGLPIGPGSDGTGHPLPPRLQGPPSSPVFL
ncbi:MAG: hypothetical protein ACLR1T_11935 [Evtepia gabavorous]